MTQILYHFHVHFLYRGAGALYEEDTHPVGSKSLKPGMCFLLAAHAH